ncbi:MAG TPA: hypothetical protein VGK25_12670 [Ignavibacteria bacterium]
MKILKLIIIFAFSFFIARSVHSQMKFNAGMLYGNIDGDTISFDLKTDLNNLYYMTMGGTADFGLIKIQWDEVKTPTEVKVQTLNMEKGFVVNEKEKISVIWADFYTNLPYIINSGKLSVTSNDGSTITGILEISAELGGNSIIGEFLKGKKETNLKNGYFEIKY